MTFPENIKYTKDHEWIKVTGTEALVGITDYAQGELGDIVFVEVETIGESLSKGQVFGTIEAVKTVSDLFIPIAAEVIELNAKLDGKPELINQDPYGEGWIVKLKINNASDLDQLMSSQQYQEMINA